MDPHFDGVIFRTHAAELKRRISRPFPPCLILDVRPREAFEAGHIPGALSTSPEELHRGLPTGADPGTELFVVGEGPPDPEVVRAASRVLMRRGARRVVELTGGMVEWQEAGYQVEAGSAEAKAA